MTEQQQNLKRVADRIGEAILDFARVRMASASFTAPYFHADELRRHVEEKCGTTAPGSADRVLRLLRQAKKINYVVINRRRSMYELRRVAP